MQTQSLSQRVPLSVCSETSSSSLCFSLLPSPLTLVSAEVYSGSLTLSASPHFSSVPSLLLLIFFGQTVLYTCSLSISVNSKLALNSLCIELVGPSVEYHGFWSCYFVVVFLLSQFHGVTLDVQQPLRTISKIKEIFYKRIKKKLGTTSSLKWEYFDVTVSLV